MAIQCAPMLPLKRLMSSPSAARCASPPLMARPPSSASGGGPRPQLLRLKAKAVPSKDGRGEFPAPASSERLVRKRFRRGEREPGSTTAPAAALDPRLQWMKAAKLLSMAVGWISAAIDHYRMEFILLFNLFAPGFGSSFC